MVDLNPKEKQLFDEIKSLSVRLLEDRLYEVVADEVLRNEYDNVAKIKALEEARGDEQVAKSIYTRHRVRRLKDAAAAYYATHQQPEADRVLERKQQSPSFLDNYFPGIKWVLFFVCVWGFVGEAYYRFTSPFPVLGSIALSIYFGVCLIKKRWVFIQRDRSKGDE